MSAVTVDSATGPEALPAPIAATYAEIATGGTRAATLESVIVSLGASAVSAVNATAGEFTLTSGADTLIVDDFLLTFTNPPLNQNYNAVTGILTLRNSASKLEPRSAADLVLGAPGLAAFGPALSFIRTGTTGSTFPVGSELTVTLSGQAQGDTVVTVVSGSTDVVVVGGGVTVLSGQTTAKVQLQGINANADVTLMATLGTTMLSADVRVLGAADVPTTVTLSPSDAAVAPAGTVAYTVSLDLPADVAETITLAVNPSDAGTLPAIGDDRRQPDRDDVHVYRRRDRWHGDGDGDVRRLDEQLDGHGLDRREPPRHQRGRLRSGRHRHRRVRRDLQPVANGEEPGRTCRSC